VSTSDVSPRIKSEYGCVLRISATMVWFKSIRVKEAHSFELVAYGEDNFAVRQLITLFMF
jgi:hypothetical protein